MTRWEIPTIFVCVDCRAAFRYDESPSTEHCAECAAWHEWWRITRSPELSE